MQQLITAHPDNLVAILAFGGILRERKQYADCADVYSKDFYTNVEMPK